MDYMSHPQAYVPSNAYIDPMAFPSSYDTVPMSMAEAPRPQDLQFHYDGIAQGVKQSMHYSPAASPSSGAHSFDTQPPMLSASSESGASVSSSAMGSPSLNPQYDASWNAMHGLGLTQYDGLVVNDKLAGCVGESPRISSSSESPSLVLRSNSMPTSNASSPASGNSHNTVFKSPKTPASAFTSYSSAMRRSPSVSAGHAGRRGSLLSKEILPAEVTNTSSKALLSSPHSYPSPSFPKSETVFSFSKAFHLFTTFPPICVGKLNSTSSR